MLCIQGAQQSSSIYVFVVQTDEKDLQATAIIVVLQLIII